MWIIIATGIFGFFVCSGLIRCAYTGRGNPNIASAAVLLNITILTMFGAILSHKSGKPIRAREYTYSSLSHGVKYRVIGRVDHFILITDDIHDDKSGASVWVIDQPQNFDNGSFQSNSLCTIVDGYLRNVYENPEYTHTKEEVFTSKVLPKTLN